MNLQQMRYLCAVIDHDFNISDAAETLYTSQPGISKQIRLLEDELGVKIFLRYGKRITELTEPGKAVLSIARRILQETENLKRVGQEYSAEDVGTFALATTHTQARYVLPKAIKAFSVRYPKVKLVLHQGNPTQVAEHVSAGEADLGIATEALESYPDLVTLPCYQWNRCVIAPIGHPITKQKLLTLEAIARFPIITYDFTFTGRSQINAAFEHKGLKPNVVLSALDSDVIKTYVELGLGIGILAQMAYEPQRDSAFAMLDASHLFAASTTRVAIRRGVYLRRYVVDFITLFAPHLDRRTIEAALHGGGEQYEL